jgi:hypothetical protein
MTTKREMSAYMGGRCRCGEVVARWLLGKPTNGCHDVDVTVDNAEHHVSPDFTSDRWFRVARRREGVPRGLLSFRQKRGDDPMGGGRQIRMFAVHDTKVAGHGRGRQADLAERGV